MASEVSSLFDIPLKVSSGPLPKKLQVGNRQLTCARRMVQMRESTELFQRRAFPALRARLEADGFLLIRGVVDGKVALQAREMLLTNLFRKGAVQVDDADVQQGGHQAAVMRGRIANNPDTGKPYDGWTVDAESGGVVGDGDLEYDSWREIGNSEVMRSVYNGPYLHGLYRGLFGDGFVPQPNCTWLRMKGRGEVTVEHVDYYYFKGNTELFAGNRMHPPAEADALWNDLSCLRCGKADDAERLLVCDLCDRGCHTYCATPAVPDDDIPSGEWHCTSCADHPLNVYTCWVSLGHAKYESSTLCIVPKTHKLSGYDNPKKKQLVPREYAETQAQHTWQVAEMGPGDIFLFNIKSVHAATKNTTRFFRCSLDTRVVGQLIQTPHQERVQSSNQTDTEEDEDSGSDAQSGSLHGRALKKRRMAKE